MLIGELVFADLAEVTKRSEREETRFDVLPHQRLPNFSEEEIGLDYEPGQQQELRLHLFDGENSGVHAAPLFVREVAIFRGDHKASDKNLRQQLEGKDQVETLFVDTDWCPGIR